MPKQYPFTECTQMVERQLMSMDLHGRKPAELYAPIIYTLSTGGKRIRPAYTLMSCNLFSDEPERAIMPAVAIEIFHNYSLVHDDIMDKALLRRNKPTVHVKWSENAAILSGDAMFILACQYLSKTPLEVAPQVMDVFYKTTIEVCEGQQLDMNFEARPWVTIPEYMEMIRQKTAVLLAASLKIGAICGGASSRQAEILYKYGMNLGLAFQIQDDFLDVYGNPDTFGKAIGGDILCNKKTFLLITAFEKAGADGLYITDAMAKYYIHPTDKVETITKIYNELDIKKETEAEIQKYYALAMEALRELDIPDHRKKVLLDASEMVMKRDH